MDVQDVLIFKKCSRHILKGLTTQYCRDSQDTYCRDSQNTHCRDSQETYCRDSQDTYWSDSQDTYCRTHGLISLKDSVTISARVIKSSKNNIAILEFFHCFAFCVIWNLSYKNIDARGGNSKTLWLPGQII